MYAVTFNIDQTRLEKIYRQFSGLAYDDVRRFLKTKGFNLIAIGSADGYQEQLSPSVREVLTEELAKKYPWFSSCISGIGAAKE